MKLIIVALLLVAVILIAIGVMGLTIKHTTEPKAQVDYCQELTQGRMPEVCK